MTIVMFAYLIGLILLCMFCLWGFYQINHGHRLMAMPNERSSHTMPTLSSGGSIFALIWLVVFFIIDYRNPHRLVPGLPGLCVFVIAVIGLLDDHYYVPASLRLFVYLTVSSFLVFVTGGMPVITLMGNPILLGLGGSLLAVFLITWSINLFNFMDGTDGFAAIEAIFIFSWGGLLMFQAGDHFLALSCWALVAILFGFLCFNFPPAKIFMGDAGSAFLGFLVLAFAVLGQSHHHISLLLWLMLYGAFIFDATVTLLRRMLKRQPWHLAHRLHGYQRLQDIGFSHRDILFTLLCINAVISGLVWEALVTPSHDVYYALVEGVFLAALYGILEKKRPMFKE